MVIREGGGGGGAYAATMTAAASSACVSAGSAPPPSARAGLGVGFQGLKAPFGSTTDCACVRVCVWGWCVVTSLCKEMVPYYTHLV
jgi:hypothetical protein